MNRHIHVLSHDVGAFAEDAPAFADVPKDKIIEGIAFDGRKKIPGRVRDKAVEGAVGEHPYEAIGIAFGVGAFIGSLLARRGI